MSYQDLIRADTHSRQIERRLDDVHPDQRNFDYGQTMRYPKTELTERKLQNQSLEENRYFDDNFMAGASRQLRTSYQGSTSGQSEFQGWMQRTAVPVTQIRMSDTEAAPHQLQQAPMRSENWDFEYDAIPLTPNGPGFFHSGRVDLENVRESYTV